MKTKRLHSKRLSGYMGFLSRHRRVFWTLSLLVCLSGIGFFYQNAMVLCGWYRDPKGGSELFPMYCDNVVVVGKPPPVVPIPYPTPIGCQTSCGGGGGGEPPRHPTCGAFRELENTEPSLPGATVKADGYEAEQILRGNQACFDLIIGSPTTPVFDFLESENFKIWKPGEVDPWGSNVCVRGGKSSGSVTVASASLDWTGPINIFPPYFAQNRNYRLITMLHELRHKAQGHFHPGDEDPVSFAYITFNKEIGDTCGIYYPW